MANATKILIRLTKFSSKISNDIIDSFATGSSATACSTGSPSVTIYALPGYTVPIVTMIFYTDLALTTPYVGGAGWRKFTNGVTNYAGEVDATGELTNYVTC